MVEVTVTNDCIGCGACAAIAGDIFEMDSATMKVKVKQQPTTNEQEDLVKQAADACPVAAIKIQ